MLLTGGEEQQPLLRLHPDSTPISHKKQKQSAGTRATKTSLMAPVETRVQLGTTKKRKKRKNFPWDETEWVLGPALCLEEGQEYFWRPHPQLRFIAPALDWGFIRMLENTPSSILPPSFYQVSSKNNNGIELGEQQKKDSLWGTWQDPKPSGKAKFKPSQSPDYVITDFHTKGIAKGMVCSSPSIKKCIP